MTDQTSPSIPLPSIRPGAKAWRIGETPGKQSHPITCVIIRVARDGMIEVRASTFSTQLRRVPAEDVFTDREACRAEIQRRRAAEGSTS